MAETEHCALCGMEIHGDPVVREVNGEEVHFDTTDCADLYEAAAAAGVLDDVLSDKEPDKPGLITRLTHPHATVFFQLDGMWCASCATSSEKVLMHADGVYDSQISFAAGRGRIDYDPSVVDVDQLMHKLEALGYHPRLVSGDAEEQAADRSEEHALIQLIVAIAFAMQVMLLYFERLYGLYAAGDFTSSEVRMVQYLVWGLATPALFYGGQSFLRGAWQSAKARTANMDTLVALGTLAAYGYSVYGALVGGHEVYFDSVAMITTFVMLGRYLETIGGTRARKDVRALLELQPSRAWKQTADGLKQVRVADLSVGDTVVVKPGERVPVDGRVVEGTASVDEAVLTGESVPVVKHPGDEVLAGTLAQDSALTCTVVRLAEDTRLAHVRQLVQATLATKAPVQRLADKASAWLTFGIFAVSVVTFAAWMLLGEAASTALIHAVAVLVVACPCALGLATPLAMSVSLGAATRNGIFVRDPAVLETASQVNRVAFDKTGTLTQGDLKVVSVDVAAGQDKQTVTCLAAGAEVQSEHPLGRAIARSCPTPPPVHGFSAHPGLGVEADIDGSHVLVGSRGFMPDGEDSGLAKSADTYGQKGDTVVWVANNGAVVATMRLRDDVKPGVAKALDEVRSAGLTPVLLSGDEASTTTAVAEGLGIEEHHGRLTPEDKAKLIQGWQADGDKVLMVGDGVNDAPALAQADVSITVSGGTDVASQTSDVVLTKVDLALIPWFVHLSATTRRVTRQNLGWALGYNAVAVPLAAFGIISPAIAAATMATSSLLVVGNSLRLRRLLAR